MTLQTSSGLLLKSQNYVTETRIIKGLQVKRYINSSGTLYTCTYYIERDGKWMCELEQEN